MPRYARPACGQGAPPGMIRRVGYREYLANRWAADRLSRTTWVLLAVFGVLVAVLTATVLSNPVERVLFPVVFGVYAVVCVVQSIRTRRT